MSLKCPRCGRSNAVNTRECACGEDLTALGSGETKPPRRCPLCQGDNVRLDGWASVETRVQFGTKWMGPGNAGYLVKCFACLDCGYVGHFLGAEDLQRLQAVPISTAMETRPRSGCLGVLLLVAFALGSAMLLA